MIVRIYDENGNFKSIGGNIDKNKEYLKELLKENASKSILEKYPQFKQTNALMGLYGEQYKTDMITYIQSVRAKIEELEIKINAAKSQKELDRLDYSI